LDKARKEAEPLKKAGYDTYFFTFFSPIPKGFYLDYNVYVPKDREIYIQTIKGKAAKNRYRSMDEFMDDIRRISENARLYHTQGEKRVAHIPELGEGLVRYMQEEVDKALEAYPELASPQASVPSAQAPLVSTSSYIPQQSDVVQGVVPGVQDVVPPQQAVATTVIEAAPQATTVVEAAPQATTVIEAAPQATTVVDAAPQATNPPPGPAP
jgi:hypothetical protein